ncbi:MAG: hypothetical protein PWR10_1178 [Halanaerobiales bacterium]|nr:hypothetical protein [Halanaerobiales bacterium]
MEEVLKKILKKIEKIDDLEKQLNKINEKVNRIDDLEKKLNEINEKADRIDDLEEKLNEINEKVDRIETQQGENTKILQALEHASKVHKAELDKLTHQIAEISGTQEKIKEDIETIKDEIDIISINTAKNSLDIAKIKSIK